MKHMITKRIFLLATILFATVVAKIYDPTNSVLGFLFLHDFSSTYYL